MIILGYFFPYFSIKYVVGTHLSEMLLINTHSKYVYGNLKKNEYTQQIFYGDIQKQFHNYHHIHCTLLLVKISLGKNSDKLFIC